MFDPTTWVGFHTGLSPIGIAGGLVAAGRSRPVAAGIFLETP